MYMVVMYDVAPKRTTKFLKLLRRYLQHTQYSVLSGDITEAQAETLRGELSRLMIPGDKVVEITTPNRHNIHVHHLIKDESGKGPVKRVEHTEHKQDYVVF